MSLMVVALAPNGAAPLLLPLALSRFRSLPLCPISWSCRPGHELGLEVYFCLPAGRARGLDSGGMRPESDAGCRA